MKMVNLKNEKHCNWHVRLRRDKIGQRESRREADVGERARGWVSGHYHELWAEERATYVPENLGGDRSKKDLKKR